MNWRQVIREVLTREGVASELSQEKVEWAVARVLGLLRGRFRCIEARPALTERWWPVGYHPASVSHALLPREQQLWARLRLELEAEASDWPKSFQRAITLLVGYYVCADRPFDL